MGKREKKSYSQTNSYYRPRKLGPAPTIWSVCTINVSRNPVKEKPPRKEKRERRKAIHKPTVTTSLHNSARHHHQTLHIPPEPNRSISVPCIHSPHISTDKNTKTTRAGYKYSTREHRWAVGINSELAQLAMHSVDCWHCRLWALLSERRSRERTQLILVLPLFSDGGVNARNVVRNGGIITGTRTVCMGRHTRCPGDHHKGYLSMGDNVLLAEINK